MPMPLREVLRDPTVAAAEPLVLAGRTRLGRLVTWVHTSEVLDIASLLRGGELLLVGGVSLATASPAQRVTYIQELAARQVAGIAIETGGRLPAVPEEMVAEAERRHLPLIELRRVVRFVEVTQSINGTLVNESVRRLQLADRVSHALAAGLADGAEVGRLMTILAAEVNADATLTAPNGDVIAEARAELAGPVAPAQDRPIVAPVSSAGVTVALLTLNPRPGADLLLLDAARDRAPEALGLALLRSRPLSRLERDAHELLGLAAAGGRSPRRFVELATRLGINTHDAWVCTVAQIGPGHGLTAGIEAAVSLRGRTVISQIDHDSYLSVVALRLERSTLAAARAGVIEDLRDVPLPPQVKVAVGPGTRALTGIAHCLAEAEVRPRPRGGLPGGRRRCGRPGRAAATGCAEPARAGRRLRRGAARRPAGAGPPSQGPALRDPRDVPAAVRSQDRHRGRPPPPTPEPLPTARPHHGRARTPRTGVTTLGSADPRCRAGGRGDVTPATIPECREDQRDALRLVMNGPDTFPLA